MATNLNSLGLTRQSHFKPYFFILLVIHWNRNISEWGFFETWLISICLFLKDDVLLKSVLKNEFFLSLTILFHRSLWRQHRRRLWKSLSWSWARQTALKKSRYLAWNVKPDISAARCSRPLRWSEQRKYDHSSDWHCSINSFC